MVGDSMTRTEFEPVMVGSRGSSDSEPAHKRILYPAGVTLVFLATVGLCLPFYRLIAWLGDEGVLLQGAARLLDGQTLYRDFFEFLPPVGFLLTAAWFKLFGVSFTAARALALFCLAVTATLTFVTSFKASGKAVLSITLAILWVIMLPSGWMVVNHHYITTMFSMIALWGSLPDSRQGSRTSWVAGLAAGLAIMTTPTRGALVALASIASIARLEHTASRLFWFVLGLVSGGLPVVVYLISTASVMSAIDDVLIFPFTQYSSIQSVPFGFGVQTSDLFIKWLIILSLPLAALVFLFYRRTTLKDVDLAICVFFCIAGIIGCYPRPDMVHLKFNAPLFMPLFALGVARLTDRWPVFVQRLLVLGLVLISTPAITAYVRFAEGTSHAPITTTSKGDVAFLVPGAAAIIARIDKLPRADSIFYYPYMPMMPFLTGHLQDAPYDIFVPYYTTKDQYRKTCDQIMKHTAWAVVDPVRVSDWFPAMPHEMPAEFDRFERALDHGFDLKTTLGSYEVRHRNGTDMRALCADIAK